MAKKANHPTEPTEVLPPELDTPPVRLETGQGLAVFGGAEIEYQVATAKRYPRSVATFQRSLMSMATSSREVAESCMYALSRGGKAIEGPSARFAELAVSAWGNCRAGARIIAVEAKEVVAQGACHDLENNVAETFEVRRRITDRDGKRYSDDMITVTGNAAASIAFRNAALKVVPSAFWKPVFSEVRKVIAGTGKDLKKRLQEALDECKSKYGVTPERVYKTLGVKGPSDMDVDKLVLLRGLITAIDEGDTSAQEAFGGKRKPTPPPEQAEGGHGLNEGQDQQIRAALYRSSKDGGVTLAEFCEHFGIKDTKDLPAAKMNEGLNFIKNPVV